MKKIYSKLLIVLFLSVFTSLNVIAQIGPSPTPTVPSASELTDAENYHAGYTTGVLIAQGHYGPSSVAYQNTIDYAYGAGNFHYLEGVVNGYAEGQTPTSNECGADGCFNVIDIKITPPQKFKVKP